MDVLFEVILELVLEGSIEAIKSRKIPNYIRYPLIIMISLFFIAVIALLFFAGALALKESIPAGILLISIGVFFLVMSVIKFRKTYLSKTK